MSVEILIKKIILDGGNVRFDLIGKNLPGNFLGMAADLKFTNNGGDVKYEKMEWGSAFMGFVTENVPVKMVKNAWQPGQNEGKIIFGISLKADNLKNLHDGVIGSFYFSGKSVAADLQFAGFQHVVLSVYENGRVDLTDVKWGNAGQIKMPTEIISSGEVSSVEGIKVPLEEGVKSPVEQTVVKNQIIGMKKGVASLENPTSDQVSISNSTIYPNDLPNLDEVMPNDSASVALAELRGMDISQQNQLARLSDNQFFWWMIPALIGLPLLFLGGWLYLRKRARNRTWQYSPA